LPEIPWQEMGQALLPLLGITALAGGLSHWLWTQLRSHEILGSSLITAALWAGLAAGIGLSLFAAGALYLRIPEVNWLAAQIQTRLSKIASQRSPSRS
jgi:putative peptidoglycan lipid II flippase